MSAPDVAVVDYGLGNLLSVRRGLEFCGATVDVTADPAAILAAPRVLLPGVGAFANGMGELRRTGLDHVVQEVAARGTPLLGICLGMQLLFDGSEEFGTTLGLGLIPGPVVALPTRTRDGAPQKVPHIGWNALLPQVGSDDWAGTLLEDIVPGEAAYFVHSFTARPDDALHRLADCQYGDVSVSAVVVKGNVSGCQFHPEKSGDVGLKMLRRFLTL